MAKVDLRPNREEMPHEEARPAVGKLSVTVATKLDDEMAWRYRVRAQQCGMSEAQLYRLILDRFDILFHCWDERVNPKFFIDQVTVRPEQFTLFTCELPGKLHPKR